MATTTKPATTTILRRMALLLTSSLFSLLLLHGERHGIVEAFSSVAARNQLPLVSRRQVQKLPADAVKRMILPSSSSSSSSSSVVLLFMGLYDRPLPPRPPPRDNKKNEKFNDDDEEDEDENDYDIDVTRDAAPSPLLFAFDDKGREVNNRLPSLGRRLDSGIGCYFEATDRLVQNLVDKTGCAVEDACWALEACKGDVTEAWTRISVARRTQLNTDRMAGLGEDGKEDGDDFVEWDPEEYDIEMEEAFLQQKERRLKDQKQQQAQQNREDWMRGGTPDANWLPKPNPRPVDDEPWFTG